MKPRSWGNPHNRFDMRPLSGTQAHAGTAFAPFETMRLAFLCLVTVSSVLLAAEPETKTAQLSAKAERAWKVEFRQCLAACGNSPRTECVESCELDCSARAYEEQGVLSTPACEK